MSAYLRIHLGIKVDLSLVWGQVDVRDWNISSVNYLEDLIALRTTQIIPRTISVLQTNGVLENIEVLSDD